MRLSQRACSCILIAVAATWAAPQARAQDGWQGGAPVFQSEVEKRQRDVEAQREAIRKSYPVTAYPKFMDGGDKPNIAPEKPPVVYLDKEEPPGTIIVDTGGRTLYYVLPGKQAYAYPISVGRDGFTWTGTEKISRVTSWPSWTPPPEMRQRQPGLPVTVSGGVINPLGAKALYLGNTIYRIHGTSNERSIGRASSSGCFRMLNPHVTHLATLARVGTTVRVVANYTAGVSTSAPISSLFSGFSFGDDEPPKKTSSKSGPGRAPAARAASAKTVRPN